MIFRTLLFTILCFAGNTLYSQTNWESASITTTSGEIIQGYAEDRRWRFRIRSLRFRENADARVVKYSLSELSAFRLGDRRYLVQDVKVNTSPRDPQKLVPETEKTYEKQHLALLTLIDGPISLYEFTDEDSNRHYYIKERGRALEYLDFGKYKTEKRFSKTFYKESNTFRGTLLRVLDGCTRLRPEIIKAKYRKDDLVSLINNYYRCGAGDPDYELRSEKGVWSVGLDAGMIQATPTYGEIEDPVYPFRDLTSWDPALGAHVKYRFGGRRGNVALRLGAQYHSFNVSSSAPDLEEEDPSTNSTFQYNYTEQALHIQLGAEVIIVRSRLPLFLETMAEYHQLFDYRENRFNRRVVNGQEVITGQFNNFSNRGALSLSAGVGVVVGNARLSLRGSATRRKYPRYVLNLYRVGVMGSYDF